MRPIKKIFYVHSHMVKAGEWVPQHDSTILDELLFSGGMDFSIELVELGQMHTGMRLKVFDDSWKVFEIYPELFKILSRLHKGSREDSIPSFKRLINDLQTAGWKLQKPAKNKIENERSCRACGKSKD